MSGRYHLNKIQIGVIMLTAEAIAFVVIQTSNQQISVPMLAVRLLFNISNRYFLCDVFFNETIIF